MKLGRIASAWAWAMASSAMTGVERARSPDLEVVDEDRRLVVVVDHQPDRGRQREPGPDPLVPSEDGRLGVLVLVLVLVLLRPRRCPPLRAPTGSRTEGVATPRWARTVPPEPRPTRARPPTSPRASSPPLGLQLSRRADSHGRHGSVHRWMTRARVEDVSD
jgi:hypothetical protein